MLLLANNIAELVGHPLTSCPPSQPCANDTPKLATQVHAPPLLASAAAPSTASDIRWARMRRAWRGRPANMNSSTASSSCREGAREGLRGRKQCVQAVRAGKQCKVRLSAGQQAPCQMQHTGAIYRQAVDGSHHKPGTTPCRPLLAAERMLACAEAAHSCATASSTRPRSAASGTKRASAPPSPAARI